MKGTCYLENLNIVTLNCETKESRHTVGPVNADIFPEIPGK